MNSQETGTTSAKKRWQDALAAYISESRSASARTNRHGFGVLYRKELADHLESPRLSIIFALLLIVTLVSLFAGRSQLSELMKSSSEFNFLKLLTVSGGMSYAYVTFIGFLGPLFGIMLGFDAINDEEAQGTLNRLAAQPIYRDTIINAKFCAAASMILMSVTVLTGLLCALGILTTGLTPSGEEVLRVLIFIVFSSVYISVWLAIAIFFSVVSRHAASSALSSVALWLFLTLFMGLIASGLSALAYAGGSGIEAEMNVLKAYGLESALNRISPFYLYTEAVSTILNPNIRSLNLISLMQESYNGAVASYLSLGQSLLLIWPQLIALIAMAVAGFAAAYISFMRREIRA